MNLNPQLFFILILCMISCQSKSSTSNMVVDQNLEIKQKALSAFADDFKQELIAFDTAQAKLLAQIEKLAMATSERENTQLAWKEAMKIWQRLETIQIGPLCASDKCEQGADLRDEIYSWPLHNDCRIDQLIADQQVMNEAQFESMLVNTYGLGVLEQLLLDLRLTHHCPSVAGLDEKWNALGEAEITKRRIQYALLVGKRGKNQSMALLEKWKGFEGMDAQKALDEVFSAMMYIDLMVKDDKIGIPAGIHIDCEQEICPELEEFVYAQYSLEAIKQNIDMLKKTIEVLFTPIVAAEQSMIEKSDRIDQKLIAQIDQIKQQLDAFPLSFSQTIEQDLNRVKELHQSFKDLVTLLRGEFMTTLNLSVPKEGASDND